MALIVGWSPVRHQVAAGAVAVSIAVAGLAGTYEAVKDYDYTPPLKTYAVTMECRHTGQTRVCMPEQTASGLPQAVDATRRVLADLSRAGVSRHPKEVIDTLPAGRFYTASTASTWRVPLTVAGDHHDTAFAVTIAAAGMNCPRPDPLLRRVVIAWAAHITGTTQSWERLRSAIDRQGSPGDVDGLLRSVLSRSARAQAAWFTGASRKACAV